MARYTGTLGSIDIGGNLLGEIKSFELTLSREVITGIALGETWVTSEYGDASWSGTATCHFDPDDTNGQVALQNALINATDITIALYVEGQTTGDWELTGTVIINEWGGSVTSNNEHSERTFTFTGDGAPTIGTAA